MDPMDSRRRRNRPHGSTAQVGPHGWKRLRRDEMKRTRLAHAPKPSRRMADRPRRRFRGPPLPLVGRHVESSSFLFFILFRLPSFSFVVVVVVSSRPCQSLDPCTSYILHARSSLASLRQSDRISNIPSVENCETAAQSEILVRSRSRTSECVFPFFFLFYYIENEEKVGAVLIIYVLVKNTECIFF